MSGSPVYLNGKLAGALAFRIGEFSKEPIAGVTPIAEMLEINAMDRSPGSSTVNAEAAVQTPTRTSGPGADGLLLTDSTRDYANYLKPIEAPLVFSGFSQEAMQRFAPQFAKAGIVPVMGVGSVSESKQPEPLEPGSAISAILVRGDMDIAATCTVTYMDAQHLLACGHPLLQFGMVDLPMTKAEVLATLPSPLNAFKIVNATEPVGAFVQDRHTGILGEFGKQPEMIPVTLNIHGGAADKQFHYEVLNNANLSPLAMMATVFNALHGVNEYGEDTTYRMNGRISVNGYPDVTVQNMFAPSDGGQPAAVMAALSLGERFSRIYDNPYNVPGIRGVQLDFDLVRERRWARLEGARTDLIEARPGDEITIETVLRPYRGEVILQQIPIHIPTSTSQGSAADSGQRWRDPRPRSPRQPAAGTQNGPGLHHRSAQQTARQQSRLCFAAGGRSGSHGRGQGHAHSAALHHERDGQHARHPGNDRAGRVFGERGGHRPAGLRGRGRAGPDHYDQVECCVVAGDPARETGNPRFKSRGRVARDHTKPHQKQHLSPA